MPLRLGASGSVRASSRHQSACMPPLAHSFWPLTTIASPSRRADGAQARQVGSGLGFGETLDPDLAVEDRRKVPSTLLVGARGEQRRCGVVDADEREHEPGCVVGGQLLVEHDLLGRHPACRPPHSRGQCGTAKPAACSSANHAFWKRTNSSSLTPVWASRQSGGMCSSHQARTLARNSSRSAVTRTGPSDRSGPPVGSEVARRGQPEREPPQRLAVAGQPRQGGLVAEPDRTVQLVAYPEDHLGGLDGRHPQCECIFECFGTAGCRYSTARIWRESPARCVRPRHRSAGTGHPGTPTAAARTACAGSHARW